MSVAEQIEDNVTRAIPGSRVTVGGDGYRWEIEVVSATFEGMNRVKKQQAVYAAIGDLIKSGAVHAVTILARTPAEAGGNGG